MLKVACACSAHSARLQICVHTVITQPLSPPGCYVLSLHAAAEGPADFAHGSTSGLVTGLALAMLTDRALLVSDGDASANLFAALTPSFDLSGTTARLKAVTAVPKCRHVRASCHSTPAPALLRWFILAAVALIKTPAAMTELPVPSRDAKLCVRGARRTVSEIWT